MRALLVESGAVGWASVVVLLSFFNGTAMMCLAMLGEYTVRLLNQTSGHSEYHIRKGDRPPDPGVAERASDWPPGPVQHADLAKERRDRARIRRTPRFRWLRYEDLVAHPPSVMTELGALPAGYHRFPKTRSWARFAISAVVIGRATRRSAIRQASRGNRWAAFARFFRSRFSR